GGTLIPLPAVLAILSWSGFLCRGRRCVVSRVRLRALFRAILLLHLAFRADDGLVTRGLLRIFRDLRGILRTTLALRALGKALIFRLWWESCRLRGLLLQLCAEFLGFGTIFQP